MSIAANPDTNQKLLYPTFLCLYDTLFATQLIVQRDIIFPNVVHYSEHADIGPRLLTATDSYHMIDSQSLLAKYADKLIEINEQLTKQTGMTSLINLMNVLYLEDSKKHTLDESIAIVSKIFQERQYVHQHFINTFKPGN